MFGDSKENIKSPEASGFSLLNDVLIERTFGLFFPTASCCSLAFALPHIASYRGIEFFKSYMIVTYQSYMIVTSLVFISTCSHLRIDLKVTYESYISFVYESYLKVT
jgi:hypothetical protein